MSLRSLMQLARKVGEAELARIRAYTNPKRPRQDDGLPFGARVGSYIQLNGTRFLETSLFGSIATPPDEGSCKIIAISRLKPEGWDDTERIYRYYFAIGTGDEPERFLQVYMRDGELVEAVYFTRLHRLFISDDGERKFFSGEADDGVGLDEYFFDRETLEGVLPADVFGRLGDAAEVLYTRAIGGDEKKIDMISAREERIDDPAGDTGMRQDVLFMPYVRSLADGAITEHLDISMEVERERGRRIRDAHVDFMIGLPITEGDVLVA